MALPQPVHGGATIGQVFQSKKLWAWFSSTPTNYFDGQSEKGEDYSTSFGTPVAVPVGGTIMRIVHNTNAINDIVELQDSTGAVWLYQHITSKVKVGQTLGCGGIIGTENGLPVDQYSTGPHIEVRYCPAGKWSIGTDSWVEPWINPRAIFSGLANQTAGSTANDNGGVFSTLASAMQNTPIAPNADVAGVFVAMDTALQVINPFQVTQSDVQIFGINTGVPDTSQYIGSVFTNLVQDGAALTVRFTCGILGIVILYLVAQALILSSVNKTLEPVGGVSGAVSTATKLGVFA